MPLRSNRLVEYRATDGSIIYVRFGRSPSPYPTRDYLMCVSDARSLIKLVGSSKERYRIMTEEESTVIVTMDE